jgi:GDP-fucose transporter C1
VFANKYLVGGSSTADISLFVSWLQCVVTVALTFALRAAGTRRRGVPLAAAVPPSEHFIARPVLIMSACFVCMLSFNNMCLKLVGVSFYQVSANILMNVN